MVDGWEWRYIVWYFNIMGLVKGRYSMRLVRGGGESETDASGDSIKERYYEIMSNIRDAIIIDDIKLFPGIILY